MADFGEDAKRQYAGKIGVDEGRVHITRNRNYLEDQGGKTEPRPRAASTGRNRDNGISPGKKGKG